MVPGILGPVLLQGCTLGWGAPGGLIRALDSLSPRPYFRQMQHWGNIHRGIYHRYHSPTAPQLNFSAWQSSY